MKKAYVYDENGYFEREGVAQIDPLESDLQGENIYIMPANSTDKEPLEPKEGFRVKWDDEKWIYEAVENAPYTPTNEEQRQARASAYAVEVDPLMSEYNRKKTFNLFEEGEEEKLMKAIRDKVAEIKERFPYNEAE